MNSKTSIHSPRQSVYNYIKGIPGDLFSWFSASNYLNEDTFTARLRSYKTVAFVVFFLCSFLNFLTTLYYSYLITSVFSIFIVFAGYLIDRGKVKSAYWLLLSCFNISLFLLAYIEGLRSGVYLFFFPCIISFAFLADFTNKRIAVFTYVICLGSFLACILTAPEYSSIQKISALIYRENFRFNVVISFTIIAWMSFSLARENQRKQVTLKNKEVFLNTIFNTSLHGELIVDMDNGLISDHNIHSANIFGLEKGETLAGREACVFFYELMQEGGKELYQQMCDPGKNWEGELTCIRNDNSHFPGNVRIASFRYNNKNYKKITITDITERKEMLQELRVAKSKAEESAAVKTQFLSNMSHELRTPLNGIIGITNLLLEDNILSNQSEQLNVLKFSSEHMLRLINDILDLSKLDAGKVSLERLAINMPRLINSIAVPFMYQFKDKGLGFEVKIDQQINHSLIGDPTRLCQVLTNLLSNALKFTTIGNVTLEVRGVAVSNENNLLEFSVSDTGIGISEEKKGKIFEQFIQADEKTTRKFGGTGLGLTISQKLVGLMGGELKMESKYKQGSRFYFDISLPVYRNKDKVFLKNKLPADMAGLKGLKVLIAEDNPVNMMIASRFLDKWGIKYRQAKNGIEAVSLYAEQDFDIILMDLEMPEMDGYDALYEIRKVNKGVPALAFTAAVFENMREKLTASGFNDYIQKPFQPEDLYARLEKFSSREQKVV